MFTEATLDFPEEDIDFVRAADAAARRRDAAPRRRRDHARVPRRAPAARRARRGARSAGPTSASRACSTAWSRDDVAIVTPMPGTTRDTVERADRDRRHSAARRRHGRPARDRRRRRAHRHRAHVGGDRARRSRDRAVVDARAARCASVAADDARARSRGCRPSLPRIVVHNKIDLAGVAPRARRAAGARARVAVGADRRRRRCCSSTRCSRWRASSGDSEDTFLARERHLVALRAAAAHCGGRRAARAPRAAARALRRGAAPRAGRAGDDHRRVHRRRPARRDLLGASASASNGMRGAARST